MIKKNPDLVIVYIIMVIGAGLGASWLHSIIWLSVFGILMTLVLPGYVFSQLLLPDLPFAERLLVSLGLSVVIDGLSGLILNLTPWGLSPTTWGLWLAIVTLLGTARLWLVRESTLRISVSDGPKIKISWRSFLLYSSALVFILLAFSILRLTGNRLDSPLTSLWANADPSNAQVLDIGMLNNEGKAMSYDLIVEVNGVKMGNWTGIVLDNGKTFSGQLTLQRIPLQPINVLLYLPDHLGQVYRQVNIYFPAKINPTPGK